MSLKKYFFHRYLIAGLFLMNLPACSPSWVSNSKNSSSAANFTPPTCTAPSVGLTAPTGLNVMPITVSNCNNASVNVPYVTIKICAPGSTTNCQTINNILLDTGSFGLRVFSGMLNTTLLGGLPAVTSGANTLAECATFGDGTSLWGSVAKADVVLGDLSGSETSSSVPIQLVNANYGFPSACPGSERDPYTAGFSGILGVGVFGNDCASCVASTAPGMYWSCGSSSCVSTTVSVANQVTNPVVNLATDNQGISLYFASVNTSLGSAASNGYLLLGIDTRTTAGGYVNNASTGKTFYSANASGEFQAVYNGSYYASFIDSGSNGLYFPNNSGIAVCASGTYAPGFLCPSPSVAITPTFNGCTSGQLSPSLAAGCNGNNSYAASLTIYNAVSLASTGNVVFSSIAAPMSTYFDVGFPFFTQKNIFVGIQGKVSGLGTGPYWGF